MTSPRERTCVKMLLNSRLNPFSSTLMDFCWQQATLIDLCVSGTSAPNKCLPPSKMTISKEEVFPRFASPTRATSLQPLGRAATSSSCMTCAKTLQPLALSSQNKGKTPALTLFPSMPLETTYLHLKTSVSACSRARAGCLTWLKFKWRSPSQSACSSLSPSAC